MPTTTTVTAGATIARMAPGGDVVVLAQENETPTARRIPLLGSAMALGAGAVWSAGVVLSRRADRTDAFQYLAWRSIGIVLVIEALALVRGRPARLVRAFTSGWAMFLASVTMATAAIGFVYAVKTTTAANAAFLASTTPVFGALAARVFLRERLDRVTVVSIVVAFVGLAVMVAGDVGAGNMVGNLAALSAAAGFALYTVCVRSDPHADWSPMLPASALLTVLVCGTVVVAHGSALVPPAPDLTRALVHGAVVITVGTMLYNVSSRQVPAAAMTVFAQSEMVLVPVWGIAFLGERPRTTTLIGGGIVLVAIIGRALVDARRARPA